jgi:hypothetical protein
MAGALRLSYVASEDLRALLFGTAGADTALHEDFAAFLSGATTVEVARVGAGGWATTLDALRSWPAEGSDGIHVLVTSALAELADPSADPNEALASLARFVMERSKGHVIVVNGSTLAVADEGGGHGGPNGGEPLDLRLRRLNLAIMEVSNATGSSVLDADRLVAETRLPAKVNGALGYSPKILRILRSALVSMLGALGLAERAAMGVRLPYIRDVTAVSIDRWLKSEGDFVAAGDVMCQLRLSGLRKLQRPRSATVLASIDRRAPLIERILTRERVRQRTLDEVVSLVAGEGAVLRKVMLPAGASLESGDVLAILSGDEGVEIDDLLKPSPFRAVIQTDNPMIEAFL